MTDIVEKLRRESERDDHRGAGLILRQAADEIDRLRNVTPLDPETAADNAALIAAIPKMVAALEEARGCLARHSGPHEGTVHGLIDEAVDQIDAVLASIGRTL